MHKAKRTRKQFDVGYEKSPYSYEGEAQDLALQDEYMDYLHENMLKMMGKKDTEDSPKQWAYNVSLTEFLYRKTYAMSFFSPDQMSELQACGRDNERGKALFEQELPQHPDDEAATEKAIRNRLDKFLSWFQQNPEHLEVVKEMCECDQKEADAMSTSNLAVDAYNQVLEEIAVCIENGDRVGAKRCQEQLKILHETQHQSVETALQYSKHYRGVLLPKETKHHEAYEAYTEQWKAAIQKEHHPMSSADSNSIKDSIEAYGALHEDAAQKKERDAPSSEPEVTPLKKK